MAKIFERFKLLSMTLDEFEEKYMKNPNENNEGEKEVKEIKKGLKQQMDQLEGVKTQTPKIKFDSTNRTYSCSECSKQCNSKSAMLNHQYFKHNRPKKSAIGKSTKQQNQEIDVDDRMDDLIILQ
ncbi:unnamed protein product (macronuclear) [Paramecium tetraurelia]|uniref:C2H2-type domain-containing protein n=1 Tax=Paramecium tetraurelia TaxID=5888 RepID=A0CY60_PARTE|nr:uncharacterized protein GSPATT00039065001 [Paramecium tetraurelia]CAK75727.1 unnamed protein product [Paramecium tetraurelia]|eukprot:XP_001443124.1 hypothetical protein (macronuclear) [Paramecium tetraurelia strain d4-2]